MKEFKKFVNESKLPKEGDIVETEYGGLGVVDYIEDDIIYWTTGDDSYQTEISDLGKSTKITKWDIKDYE